MHINDSCGGDFGCEIDTPDTLRRSGPNAATVHAQGGSTKSDEPFIPRGRWKVNG